MLAVSPGVSSSCSSFPPVLTAGAAADAGVASFDVQRDILDPVSAARLDALDLILAPDCLLLLPGMRPVTGSALTTRILRALRHRFEVLAFETVLQFRSDDDVLVANSKVRGERDGRAYVNEALSLIRLDRFGRAALITAYFKDTAALEQGRRRPLPRHV